jgi:hypothetical protein
MKKLAIIAMSLLLAIVSLAAAQEITRQIVKFPAGASGTTIEARVKGDQTIDYVLGASAGQVMKIAFSPDNPRAYFNVLQPGTEEAIFVGQNMADGNRFETALPASGDYLIRVYLVRAAARRNEVANYRLDISIGGSASGGVAPSQGSDFADGLEGGPDLWEVTGVPAGDQLNMRAGPATKEPVVMGFLNGSALRNLGCKMVGGQRWCKVARPDDPSVSGWVAGRYLKEAGAAAQAGQGSDAMVAGTNYNATGQVQCSIAAFPGTSECPFGVTRGAPGTATVFITLPNGFERVIEFSNGSVRPMSAVSSFDWRKQGDETTVTVDGKETYVIFDAVIFGG